MKNQLLPFPLLFSILLVFSCNGSKKATSGDSDNTSKTPKTAVNFDKSPTLSDVLERAEQENKLVFVDFYTTWCLPCRLMDEEVFPDKKLAKFLNENFISYKVDAEKGNGVNLAVVYQIQAYPTLLFMDANGSVLKKKVGAAFQTELMQMGRDAMMQGGL